MLHASEDKVNDYFFSTQIFSYPDIKEFLYLSNTLGRTPFLPWKMGAWKMTLVSKGPFSTSMIMGGRVFGVALFLGQFVNQPQLTSVSLP